MIFGLDLGTRRIAVVCLEPRWVFEFKVESAAGKRKYPTEEMAGIALGLATAEAIGEQFGYTGHEFFYERPFLPLAHPNPKTLVGQGLSAGAVIAHLPGRAHQISHPSLWKKDVCGNGNAGKDDARAWVEAHRPEVAALCGTSQDLYDATCIAVYGGAVVASAGDLPRAG